MKNIQIAQKEMISTNKADLDALLRTSKEIQDQCVDYTVSCNSVDSTLYNKALFMPDTGSIRFLADNHKSPLNYDVTKFSLGQLCTKLGIPSRYIDKCLKAGNVDLAGTNINSWLSEYDKSLFVRTYQNQIRGILSDRYTVLDTPEIISTLADVVDLNNFKVKGFHISPERFHVRLVDKNQLTKVDDLFAGIQIDSSDVGRHTLTVTFFIYKLVCTNGLVLSQKGGTLFSQRHIGMSVDEFRSEFKQSMSRIPSLSDEYLEIINTARKEVLSASTEQITPYLKEITSLSDSAIEKVLAIQEEKYDYTKLGLANALTEVAQEFTLERRLEIEKSAGMILTSRVA